MAPHLEGASRQVRSGEGQGRADRRRAALQGRNAPPELEVDPADSRAGQGGRDLWPTGSTLRTVREKPSFKLVARIGKTGLETAIAGSIVYYIQDLHLKAVDLGKENPLVTDYGLVTDQDGRRPQRLPALAAGTDGGIYITGDWFTQGSDTPTTRLSRDKKTGEETYPAQKRCERFAYVKVTPPGK